MAIVINIDVMLAKRKMSMTEQPFYSEKRQGQSDPVIDPGGNLRGFGLPTRRHLEYKSD